MVIHIAFQLGFCTFVLSNYMKTIPKELNEAAVVDGAGVFQTYRTIIMPLCRPPLAALATLQFTWIYNDFFWAIVLMKTGDKLPTSSLNNLSGQFFTDNNLLAAGAMIVALPTLIVYFALQKQFVAGLTLGSTKG
jgi:multiple sugar transport system permease protein